MQEREGERSNSLCQHGLPNQGGEWVKPRELEGEKELGTTVVPQGAGEKCLSGVLKPRKHPPGLLAWEGTQSHTVFDPLLPWDG